ncbi:MAG: P-II family nitrogen regulator [Verrucomicrobiota bacterium]
MKKIEALIKPARFESIKRELLEIGVRRLTASEVKDFSVNESHVEIYRSREFTVDFVPLIKLEVVVRDEHLDLALGAISGKEVRDDILISNIEHASWYRPLATLAA